ncbi:MAG: transposase [Saprospiraceae bacterium]|nr:transposase [Saprospiraceae bacterium]
MSTGYQIADKAGLYFLTFQVVDWVDIFTRKVYRDIVIDSFDYCRKHKGLQIWAYVVMSNHVHCILSAKNGNLPDVVRDFKRHTASKILYEIKKPVESRKDWMLKRFEFAAMSHIRNSKYQFWTHENHAIELVSHWFTCQKMAYIHENPVKSGLVEKAEDWMYSSQRNYSGLESLFDIDLMDL